MNRTLDINDLDGQAHAIWRLGEQLCGDCGSYHRLRGALLKTTGVYGGKHDAGTLEPLIRQLAFPGARILIAGSADAGLLRTVLDCTPARPLAITIVDLCPTPLALIESLLSVPDVSIVTHVADLTRPLSLGHFDLIFSHSMLPFVPEESRGLVVDALKGALSPSGRLILSSVIGRKMTSDEQLEARQNWYEKVLRSIDATPDMLAMLGDEKVEILRDYATRFRYMNGSFTVSDQIAALLETHGLTIEDQRFGDDVQVLSAATQGRRSAIFVAHA